MSELPLSTSDVTQEVRIRMGTGKLQDLPPTTVMARFDAMVAKNGSNPALHQKVLTEGTTAADTPWTTWTWQDYRDNVDAFGKSLLSLGFDRFDIINIIGFNSPEWFFANFGAIAAGGVAAGIYATNNPEACYYISEHSKAKVVVCEGMHQISKYLEICKNLPHLKALVMYGPDKLPSDIKSSCPVPVYTFEDFLDLGKDVESTALQDRSQAAKPGEICSLIYTSGTTGPPKSAMITHDNITWTAAAMLSCLPRGKLDPSDSLISYLPLSHIAAQMLDMHGPMQAGFQIYFAQPDALKGSLGATLKEVRPSAFFGVPRVYEKIYDKMQEVAKSTTGMTKMLSTWAKGQSAAYWESREYGSATVSPWFFYLAQILLHKVRVALGFDRCEVCFVGAAPIDVKVLKYFASLDIPIMELFGQSECTGPHSVNTLSAFKLGSVGRPMYGTETMIDKETGELCARGRHVFAGYMGMPDKTKETIDAEGWLHSGDVVEMDDDNDPEIDGQSGFISITGRIKELIITAGGENIPPVLIEEQLKAAMPAISNAMVIGDKRKFLTVLLCLQVEIDGEGVPSNKLTGLALDVGKEIGSDAKTTDEASKDPKWQAYFDNGVKKANEKATSHAQKVGKWSLLPTDFSEGGSELTPTLKLKRSVTVDKYRDMIEAMYA